MMIRSFVAHCCRLVCDTERHSIDEGGDIGFIAHNSSVDITFCLSHSFRSRHSHVAKFQREMCAIGSGFVYVDDIFG